MNLRRPGLFLALLLVVSLVAGCGGNKGAVPTPGSTPPAQTGESGESQPAAPGGSGAQSGGTAAPAGSTGTGGSTGDTGATGGTEAAGDGAPAGPGAGEGAGQPAQTEPAAPSLVKVGPLPEGAEADLGALVFKLNYSEARSAGMTFPGYDFLTMNVTVTNKSQREIVFNSLNTIQLHEPGGGTQRANVQSTAGYEGRIDQSLAAGQSVTGWIGFLVQLADGKYRLVINVPEIGEATYEFEAPPM